MRDIKQEHDTLRKYIEVIHELSKNQRGQVTQEEVNKIVDKYIKFKAKDIALIEEIIKDNKVIIRRSLDKLDQLRNDISTSNDPGKEQHEKMIHDMQVALKKELTDQLASFATFMNTTWSMKTFLDESSQTRELFYKIKQERPSVVAEDKWLKEITSQARSGKPIDEHKFKTLVEMHRAAIKVRGELIFAAIILLQSIMGDISTGKEQEKVGVQTTTGTFMKLLEKMEKEDEFPEHWAEEIGLKLTAVSDGLLVWLKREVAEGRILLSEAERDSA